MAFTKLSVDTTGAGTLHSTQPATETDIWTIFRALRDTRSVFGLRPSHIQSLQAMLSFLKPGQGETVFASNTSICQRAHGIDERTLRRHIIRFVELGFVTRNDSSNKKRYRVRSSGGACISYGLSLAPLLQRANELISLAQKMEDARRDRIFIRKQILTKLAAIDIHDPNNTTAIEVRKALRRNLNLPEYHALLATVDTECENLQTTRCTAKPTILPANDGQTVRHQSKSVKEKKDLEEKRSPSNLDPQMLAAVCDQASSFATQRLKDWRNIEDHARTLAPMMGILPTVFEKAAKTVGTEIASSAIFIILQLGQSVRNFAAYFYSITLGPRKNQFDPNSMLRRLANSGDATMSTTVDA